MKFKTGDKISFLNPENKVFGTIKDIDKNYSGSRYSVLWEDGTSGVCPEFYSKFFSKVINIF